VWEYTAEAAAVALGSEEEWWGIVQDDSCLNLLQQPVVAAGTEDVGVQQLSASSTCCIVAHGCEEEV
jgi:hypothetical protein